MGHMGFIGSHLLPKLQDKGYEVVTDLRYWDDRYDCVINLAAVTHIRNDFDPKMIESNIILVDKVFKRSERIIYASSCSAKYFTNPYAGTKLWAEYLGNKHGNALGLRFFNVYGQNNNKGIVWFLMQQPDEAKITIRGENLVRDYIDAESVANYIIYCMAQEVKYINMTAYKENINDPDVIKVNQPTGIVDVGTGIGTDTQSLLDLYMELSGKEFKVEYVPAGSNEPLSMISNNIVPHISLRDGLIKTIQQ